MRKSALVSTVVMVLAAAGTAMAQDAAPAAQPAPATAQAEPAAGEAAPAPAATAEASASASTEAAPAAEASAEAPAAAAPAAEEEASIPGWFRIDSDLNGLQLWVGATHDLGGVGIATDAYVYSYAGGSFGEFDIGPAFTAGPVIITPMVGWNFNWTLQKTNAFVPQLYIVGGSGALYFEWWNQLFIQKPFEDEVNFGLNFLYERLFLTYNFTEDFGIGPELDAWISLDKDRTVLPSSITATNPNGDGKTLMHLAVGPVAKLNYGKDNTFLGFVGYETQDFGKEIAGGSGDRAIYGRLTFVKNW